MKSIMEDYHAGKSIVSYPESIKHNVHAQAFYGVLSALYTASQGVVNIRDVDVIEKLAVPSAQPRKVKLVLFGQSHSARAQY